MNKNSLVIYKSQPAVIKDLDGDKYIIMYGKQEQKVREKDIVLLCQGAVTSLEKVLAAASDETLLKKYQSSLLETWELLISEEETADVPLSFDEIKEYAASDLAPDNAWAFYNTICSMPQFCQDTEALKNNTLQFTLRTQEQIEEINKKQYEK